MQLQKKIKRKCYVIFGIKSAVVECSSKYLSLPKVQFKKKKSNQYVVYYNHTLYCGIDFLLRPVFELCVSIKV